jgi:hypothetical protein
MILFQDDYRAVARDRGRNWPLGRSPRDHATDRPPSVRRVGARTKRSGRVRAMHRASVLRTSHEMARQPSVRRVGARTRRSGRVRATHRASVLRTSHATDRPPSVHRVGARTRRSGRVRAMHRASVLRTSHEMGRASVLQRSLATDRAMDLWMGRPPGGHQAGSSTNRSALGHAMGRVMARRKDRKAHGILRGPRCVRACSIRSSRPSRREVSCARTLAWCAPRGTRQRGAGAKAPCFTVPRWPGFAVPPRRRGWLRVRASSRPRRARRAPSWRRRASA